MKELLVDAPPWNKFVAIIFNASVFSHVPGGFILCTVMGCGVALLRFWHSCAGCRRSQSFVTLVPVGT